MLLVGALMAAIFGILLGAPTLRLRGDYLAIVTLGFGEIVPIVFLNADQFTQGPNGIGGTTRHWWARLLPDANPWPFYSDAMVVTIVVILCYRLRESPSAFVGGRYARTSWRPRATA